MRLLIPNKFFFYTQNIYNTYPRIPHPRYHIFPLHLTPPHIYKAKGYPRQVPRLPATIQTNKGNIPAPPPLQADKQTRPTRQIKKNKATQSRQPATPTRPTPHRVRGSPTRAYPPPKTPAIEIAGGNKQTMKTQAIKVL